MDWKKMGIKAAGVAFKATAEMSEEMGRASGRMSRDDRYSKEKREEYRRKSESHLDGARRLTSYYNEKLEFFIDRDMERILIYYLCFYLIVVCNRGI